MLKLRSDDLADFEHYLQVRQPVRLTRSKKRTYLRGIELGAFSMVFIPLLHLNVEVFALDCFFTLGMGLLWAKTPRKPVITPDQEMLIQADQAADTFRTLLRGRKLKSSIHPGVAAVMNECSSAWRRIVGINQERIWSQPDVASHWSVSRQDWTRASELAMAEALILSERSVTLRGPRSRAEEVIEEVIDNFVPGKNKARLEPLPVQFRELRALADKLQILAREVEAISRTIQAEPLVENRGSASQRLEDVLSQMQARREAEEELRLKT